MIVLAINHPGTIRVVQPKIMRFKMRLYSVNKTALFRLHFFLNKAGKPVEDTQTNVVEVNLFSLMACKFERTLFVCTFNTWAKVGQTTLNSYLGKSGFKSRRLYKSGHRGVIAGEFSQWIYPDVGREGKIGCIAVWYISRFIEARTILFAALQYRRPGTAQGLVPFTGWRFFILSFEEYFEL